ncbi:mitochondrial ribosomal protein [Durotheca rogersii]|uniref:mitochondrial ribosomal protein n=1 Tax=Durotheca rogersii TaxID=419775 RepID=UPI00221FB0B6|nr:mitochondrial ribosomal protein [Durotheca rogersii]KAI5866554.1 mitochondrial ribosomal protein [Durotheca rogersii]
MASANGWKCLSRPSRRLLVPLFPAPSSSSPTAAFSTSLPRRAGPPKPPEGGSSRHVRIGKQLSLGSKKNRQPDKFKPPLPGERKAFRKRIQLSNNNALEVPGLEELTAENIVDFNSVGKVARLSDAVIDGLRAVEAFKPTQTWNLFRSPHTLIRHETVDLVRQLSDAISKQETLRLVITGDRACGKSMLGLQALAAGLMNQWVVINIPEAQELTTQATEYSTIPHSEQYSQPMYIIKLFQAIDKANHHILSGFRVELDHIHLPVTVARGSSLSSLLTVTREPEFAWPVFQAFWKELTLPGRPPILFTLDGLSHIMRVSDYRSPAFELIHSHDLSLVRLYTDAIGGVTRFPNGAAIVGVCTKGNAMLNPSMDKALEQAAAAQAGLPPPPRDPFFAKYDQRVFDSLQTVKVLKVRGVTKPEARSLMEYWAASGILRLRVDEKTVSEKWTLAGSGILGEMERVALYDMRMP